MQSLSAKEGFGKKYGLSRRVAQEKLRAEMTNCEMAQVGIEKLIEVLRKRTDTPDVDSNIEIWKLLVSIIRCAIYYGKYLDGFDPKGKPIVELERITYVENKEDLALTEEEKARDEIMKK